MRPPDLDTLGRAYPLAVTKNNVFYASSLQKIKVMIDSGKNIRPSLAEKPECLSAAKGLSVLGAYCGIIGSGSLPNEHAFRLRKDIGDAPPFHNFLVFGMGTGRDFLGPFTALVLVQENSVHAAENVDILIDRINKTEWLSGGQSTKSWRNYVDYVQVKAEDNVVLAKLYGDQERYLWKNWLLEHSPLLSNE